MLWRAWLTSQAPEQRLLAALEHEAATLAGPGRDCRVEVGARSRYQALRLSMAAESVQRVTAIPEA
jgi:hypothetical protein